MAQQAFEVERYLALPDDAVAATREHIEAFIEDQVQAAGADGAVLGLSGGIDSTTTAYLAVNALGSANVRGLVMPSTVNREANMSDAEQVATALEIPYDVIEIEPIVESFIEAVPDAGPEAAWDTEPLRTAVGNVRVRTRAVLNYFVSNADNRLVLGTGNRTEALVGYFTKYGDGAVDCHPLGNLYKGQVRQLARHLGVPEDIITKTPTAGMWAGQADEAELGVTYETLDAILALTIDGPFPKRAAVSLLDDVSLADVDRIHDRYARSEHKRTVPPSPPPRTD